MKRILFFLLLFIPSISFAQSTTVKIWNGTNIADVSSTKSLFANPVAQTTNGYTPATIAALVGTVTAVKSSAAATLGGWYLFNNAATVCYIQIFDVATAGGVTLGVTAPTLSLGIPAGAAANIPAVSPGILFANGIQVASTTTRSNSTACGTGSDVNFFYK